MSSSDNDLTLHLPLDEIEDNSVLDETENDNDGTVNGHPRLLPDDLFGSCCDFDGADDFVEIKDPFDNSDAFTISIWVRPAVINDGTYHGFIGHESGGVREPGLWLAPSDGGLHYDSYDAGGTRWTDILNNFFTSEGVWVHVAWVKDAAQYKFYRGGELFAAKDAPTQFNRGTSGNYWLGKIDNFWKGQLAHARVYKRALTQEEIAELMLDDQTAASAFKRGHPLEFSVYDDDQQPVLVISDGQPDRRLHVEIANSSQRAIELAQPASPTPTPDNYHFELKFRPGTLSASARTQLGLAAEQKGWAVSRAQQADGTFSVYFLNPAPNDGAALQPGQSVVLTLQNVGAEGGGGSRGTRVELRYSQLKYVGEVAQIEGSRVQHLEIINERGKRNIPLHVGFLGPNRVLNDGHTPNELRLRITNSLGESSIPLAPKTSDAPSTFIISFDVQGDGEQREWALGTSGDLQHVEVNAVRKEGGEEVADASWIATRNAEGKSPEWELTTPDKDSLGPGEMIQLKLSNVISSLPSGQTNLYVRYKNGRALRSTPAREF
ncbi:MAG: hypothetical protein DMF65_13585 [Acidobacteria bacterium]|nr:MAG: hypothetical protein DMF65_13585 [Acidobacteriota bacterium]